VVVGSDEASAVVVAIWATVWVSGLLVLVAKFVVPSKLAVIV
jgi:hypothetical protein